MPNLYIYCPIYDDDDGNKCNYWWSWGGYLQPIIDGIKRHVRDYHKNLRYFDTRKDGGIVDNLFGQILAEPKRNDILGNDSDRRVN